MQHISAVIPSPSSMPETEGPPDSTRAMKVWVQLAELFGNAMYREYSDTPPKLWQQAIARLADSEIANGLAVLANQNLTFPANLSQFVTACKTPRKAACWQPALPPPDDREVEAEKAWRDMERLAGKKLR